MSIRRVFAVFTLLVAVMLSISAPLASTANACDPDSTPGIC